MLSANRIPSNSHKRTQSISNKDLDDISNHDDDLKRPKKIELTDSAVNRTLNKKN